MKLLGKTLKISPKVGHRCVNIIIMSNRNNLFEISRLLMTIDDSLMLNMVDFRFWSHTHARIDGQS